VHWRAPCRPIRCNNPLSTEYPRVRDTEAQPLVVDISSPLPILINYRILGIRDASIRDGLDLTIDVHCNPDYACIQSALGIELVMRTIYRRMVLPFREYIACPHFPEILPPSMCIKYLFTWMGLVQCLVMTGRNRNSHRV
jgi:hypothetical protein